jgi:hypothetical protein
VKSFVEAMSQPPYTVEEFLLDRDERFREGNDKTWGKGNWVRCMEPGCTDTLGYPSYHHKDAHR